MSFSFNELLKGYKKKPKKDSTKPSAVASSSKGEADAENAPAAEATPEELGPFPG